MSKGFLEHLQTQLEDVRKAGLYKAERVIASPQSASITVKADGGTQTTI